MPLSVGDKLGPYEILAPIGAGGMGEVYRATDPRMGRDVAIKICAERFSDRFSREVHAVAALNHPNVCHLYDVGPDYLVMELIEGPTLAERIKQGAVPLKEALGIAKQIADALEAAHEKGIVHRDLKPGNIKLRADGTVKVLDFGLAKMAETGEAGARTENSSTITLDAATRVGVILGTAAYMPPEQARGKSVDKRADIWAFGVVLYEMLTGERLFEGETVSDTLIEVATKEPEWERVPAKAQRLLRRCLEKDPKRRLRDIGDAWELLEDPRPSQGMALRHRRLPWIVAGVVAVALGALAFVHFREQPAVAELTRFQVAIPPQAGSVGPLAPQEISPDGRKLAFVSLDPGGAYHIWIRSFDSLEARALPGVDPLVTPGPLFWSSDSRSIAFLSAGHKLKKVDISGGPPQTICDAGDVASGSWSRDGVILFGGMGGGVMRVSAAGGTPTALTALDPARQERGHLFPRLLPDGRHFLYSRFSNAAGNSGIYVGAIDAKPSEQSTKPLRVTENFREYYVPSANSSDGYLLYYREGTVLAQAFNPDKLELSGDPVPVAEQVGGTVNIGRFSASTNGVLAYVGGSRGPGETQLTWFDRDGKNLGTVGEPGRFSVVALSRDGKQAAVTSGDSQTLRKGNLWLYDFTRGGASTRFTFDASRDSFPVFSPDGSRMVFMSTRDGPGNLYQKPTSGVRNEELLLKSDEIKYPWNWSPDGRFLLYSVVTQKAKDDIWILPMDGSQKPMLFQGTEFDETAAHFSPDGRWIVYESDESGRDEVYVREFSLGSDGKPEATAKHQISTGGGFYPLWRDDGKELIYVALDRRTMMSAAIATKPGFQISAAKALFQFAASGGPPAMTGDGKRFLVSVPVSQSGPQQFTVVLNWQAGLKK
jgi:Tol biopolymer transport system component/predicted Ser/Thr protein kinase